MIALADINWCMKAEQCLKKLYQPARSDKHTTVAHDDIVVGLKIFFDTAPSTFLRHSARNRSQKKKKKKKGRKERSTDRAGDFSTRTRNINVIVPGRNSPDISVNSPG